MLAVEPTPMLEARLSMLLHMLPHVASLCELLVAVAAYKGFNSLMHPQMVKEVPSSHELFPTLSVATGVDHHHLAIFLILPILSCVGEISEII
jgi:hypothetical protein